MNFNDWRGALVAAIVLFSSAEVAAQNSMENQANDQAAVWSAIERIWEAAENGDHDWVETMLSADFMGWPSDSPAPRSKASVRMWNRFEVEQTKGITHELYPLSIVVHGDMAVAHYLYTSAALSKDKTAAINNGRYTDVLVRDEGTWKFISWHGGHDDN